MFVALKRRLGRFRCFLRRPVDQGAAGEVIEPFAEFFYSFQRRQPFVRESVIHGFQSGGKIIPEPGHLNRGRLTGKYRQTVSLSMTCKVNKNINTVRADLFDNLHVAYPLCAVP